MSKLRQQLEAGRFAVTAEIVPPKGTNIKPTIAAARALWPHVQGININENPHAVMRIGSLAVSRLLAENGMEPVFHVTTRDKNRLALQSELLGAAVLDIENVLVVSGDHQSLGDHKEAKPVYDLDSVQMLHVISTLMSGRDLSGNPLDGTPVFFPGAVVNPQSEIPELEIIKMEKKTRAGARFFQTQAIFDLEAFAAFMAQIRHLDVSVLAGIVPLKSARMGRFMNEKIPGIQVPGHFLERMEKTVDREAESLAIARDLIAGCRDLCQGVHLMTIGWYDRVGAMLEGLVPIVPQS
jgi:methylenetetrahydrofolate reductase (NADPH)